MEYLGSWSFWIRIFIALVSILAVNSILDDVYPDDYINYEKDVEDERVLSPPDASELENGECRYVSVEVICFTTWELDSVGVDLGMPLVVMRYGYPRDIGSECSENRPVSECVSADSLGYLSHTDLVFYVFWRETDLDFLNRAEWDTDSQYD